MNEIKSKYYFLKQAGFRKQKYCHNDNINKNLETN